MIIWEGDPDDPTVKPPEMYTLVENFCLGLRRLEIFGRARSVRRGWVTVLADGEEQRIDSVKEKRRLDGDDDREGKLEEWERENWEGKVKEISARSAAVNVGGQGAGKAVVPMTPGTSRLLWFALIQNFPPCLAIVSGVDSYAWCTDPPICLPRCYCCACSPQRLTPCARNRPCEEVEAATIQAPRPISSTLRLHLRQTLET